MKKNKPEKIKPNKLSLLIWVSVGALIVVIAIVWILSARQTELKTSLDHLRGDRNDISREADRDYLGELEYELSPQPDSGRIEIEGESVRGELIPMTPIQVIEPDEQEADQELTADGVVRISVTSRGFNPDQFTVSAGSTITIRLSTPVESYHTLTFDDPALAGVNMAVSSRNLSNSITFQVPTSPGEYGFRCVTPGASRLGKVGVMIVQ